MNKRKFDALTASSSSVPTSVLVDKAQSSQHDIPYVNSETNPEIHSINQKRMLLGLASRTSLADNGWNTEAIRLGLFHATKNHFVGYMPIKSFLQDFLPCTPHRVDAFKNSKLPALNQDVGKERYGPFIKATEKLGLKSLRFVGTHQTTTKASVFNETWPDVVVCEKDSETHACDFNRIELWLMFQPDRKDPFLGGDVTDLDAISSSESQGRPSEAEMIIGQLVTCAVAHLGSGFFTHTFSVLIFGDKARLFRWDRAGAIVSEAFDYVSESHLVEFFLRYDNLTAEQRGKDTTITVPSKADRNEAAEVLKPTRVDGESDEDFSLRNEYLNPSSFVEYTVNDSRTATAGKTRRFVGPPPAKPPHSLHGRASRGAPVWDVENKTICYLKDTWRIDSPNQPAEGKVYDILHNKGVPHIARAVVYGDVIPIEEAAMNHQVTLTNKYCRSQEPWCVLKREIQRYIHYRIVFDEIGKDYTNFGSSKELLQATLDAMQAHAVAYSQAGILHRDISPGNIMITADGRGFLIDWDLAIPIVGKTVRSLGRTGTWRFISGLLLSNPNSKTHEYSDDLESFLHTLTYTLLCFTKSNMHPDQIRCHLDYMYDDFDVLGEDSTARGGYVKDLAFCGKQYMKETLEFVGRGGLSRGLAQISWLFNKLYRNWCKGAETKRLRASRARLNDVERGGAAFMDKLRELVEMSDAWDDASSEPVPLPMSSLDRKLNEYAARARQLTSTESLSSLEG